MKNQFLKLLNYVGLREFSITLLIILTKHKDDGKEGVPVEAQGTQQKHADAQQSACIHKQAPRNQTQESHIKRFQFSKPHPKDNSE